MQTQQRDEQGELAKLITDFVEKSDKNVYASHVINSLAESASCKTELKSILWDLIAQRQILVDSKFRLSVEE